MNKRLQLLIAIGALGIVILLLVVLLVAIVSRGEEGEALDQELVVWEPEERQAEPVDPWVNYEDRALQRAWRRQITAGAADGENRLTLRQVVETDTMQTTFQNLRWDRIERLGWRAFQLEGSVYETQFVFRDGGVEFGPSWLVQLDPDGMQPPNSGGVVPANLFAEVLQGGVSEELGRYINREAEVVEALTNHAFGGGARLASALLVYVKSRNGSTEERGEVGGWTVIPERIVPGEVNLYRASFQWQEQGQPRIAQWEVNMDSRGFRGLNLMASDVMAVGDTIDTAQIENLRPEMLDTVRPNRRQQNAFSALRLIADNDRLIEAVASLLWFESEHGKQIEYRMVREDGERRLTWGATPVTGQTGSYRVSFAYLEDQEPQSLAWEVDINGNAVAPTGEITELAHMALNYGAAVVVDD